MAGRAVKLCGGGGGDEGGGSSYRSWGAGVAGSLVVVCCCCHGRLRLGFGESVAARIFVLMVVSRPVRS